MPNPHDPSLRVPSPRLLQTTPLQPLAHAGGILLPAALMRAGLQPFHFVLHQLWTALLPLADLLGLPVATPTLFYRDGVERETSADS